MDAFKKLNGLVVPIDRANVDTDAIIPKQFLKSIKRSGFGPNAFDEWRYLDHGEPGMDNSKRKINPYFVLELAYYLPGKILGVALQESMHLGLLKTLALGSLSLLVMLIFSLIIVSKMVCCLLCYQLKLLISCLTKCLQQLVTSSMLI